MWGAPHVAPHYVTPCLSKELILFMSEQSYQLNMKRGVTGPRTGTCFPASLDRLSLETEITPQTYVEYDDVRREYAAATRDKPEFIPPEIAKRSREVYERVMADLGVYVKKNVITLRVDTEQQLGEALARLADGGFRTAVTLNTGGLHAVGVNRVDEDLYDVVSTWAPFEKNRPVKVEQIFEYLDRYPRLKVKAGGRKSFKTTNIFALPPESKR